MKFATLTFLTTLTLAGVPAMPLRLAAQSASSDITIFDAPGAGAVAGSGSGTFPANINGGGTITGHYVDANHVNHGFLRTPGGKFITFDAPGAGTAAGSGFGTFPTSINDGRTITGHYVDANHVNHGFLRTPEGKFITFDAPGAGTAAGSGFGTFPTSISNGEIITGHYVDANNLNHGFLRTPGGEFTAFEAPGAGTAGSGSGTFPNSINDGAAITGRYVDANNVHHGFLRNP